jgi:hypothetical protein
LAICELVYSLYQGCNILYQTSPVARKGIVTTIGHTRKPSRYEKKQISVHHQDHDKIALNDNRQNIKPPRDQHPLTDLLPNSRSPIIPLNSSLKTLLIARLSISTALLSRATRALAENVILVDGVLLVALWCRRVSLHVLVSDDIAGIWFGLVWFGLVWSGREGKRK